MQRRSPRLQALGRGPPSSLLDPFDDELQKAIELSLCKETAEQARRSLMAEQDREYQLALEADRLAEAQRLDAERQANEEQLTRQRLAAVKHEKWSKHESRLGSADPADTTHLLRVVLPNGARLDLAFCPTASSEALYLLVEEQLGTAEFQIIGVEPCLPINAIPNRSVQRVAFIV